jgi:hypothetical protein
MSSGELPSIVRPRLLCTILIASMIALSSGIRAQTPAQAGRLALVIGNDTYEHATPLVNARSDARAVADALTRDGFSVLLKRDLNLKQMKAALREFKERVSGGDEVVFYYSGHGVQFGGTNYLIPVDLLPESEAQIIDESVSLQRVLDDLQEQKTRFALAIIDACRNNPFKGSGKAIGGKGLAPVAAATGQMILYAAGAGQEALDRLNQADPDPNGVFTRLLVKELTKPGESARQMVESVRDQVVELTRSVGREQVPALYDQSVGEFYFVSSGSSQGPPAAITQHDSPVATPTATTPPVAVTDPNLWQPTLDGLLRIAGKVSNRAMEEDDSVAFYSRDGKFILTQFNTGAIPTVECYTEFSGYSATYKQVMSWNDSSTLARVYLDDKGMPDMATRLGLTGGVTEAQVQFFLFSCAAQVDKFSKSLTPGPSK